MPCGLPQGADFEPVALMAAEAHHQRAFSIFQNLTPSYDVGDSIGNVVQIAEKEMQLAAVRECYLLTRPIAGRLTPGYPSTSE